MAGYVVTGNKDLERVKIFTFVALFIFFGIFSALGLIIVNQLFNFGVDIWNSIPGKSEGAQDSTQVPPYFYIVPVLTMIAFLARSNKK